MPKFTFEDHKKRMLEILNKQSAPSQNGQVRVPKFIPRKRSQ